ncbi:MULTISPECIES: class I SAM-dependent methyltransferase [Alphaproteobacteria]|uniref:Methyltransferase n=2 Tax=Alphaproteobacteria TaxID=28211 RepID=A0A512HIQ1_9HYPH|nr:MULTISPECIES: class I SAM-dependent methyltransferase [Alphaproteobacteria]GEO85328.1 methyltransferase [Ciceribacter naphthalenivorans]GLR20967.1 methyltransferase [Ciceribacter naphthalenivorans]GLT03823.1 methyltransferase [Sphingomonas psychrolutea]
MSRDTLKTLFHPFASETVAAPAAGERFLFLGAEAGFAPPEAFGATIVPVQGHRGEYLRLQAARLEPLSHVEGEAYDGALVLLGKHRGENDDRVAEALSRVKTGGLVVIAGGKEDGVQPMRKRLAALGIEAEHMPKYHGVALWFNTPEDAGPAAAKLAARETLVEGRFHTRPGMFSHDRIDDGSELLASRLPENFDGNAADFGAGWGYLSAMLATRSPRTARIDLFEADYQALEYAKTNLAENCPQLTARFFWQDLTREPAKEKYDLVIMNPPFHQGHAAEPSLGQTMIKAASQALRGGGILLLVANRGLPYENILSEDFREHGETCRNARFKVLWAKK